MPHQCTTCGHVFPDGSTEMLSGCPDCGGTAFQFYPESADVPDEPPDVDPPSSDGHVGGRVGRAASTVRDLVGRSGSPPASDPRDAAADANPSRTAAWPDEREDAAQAAARGSTATTGPPADDNIIVADEGDSEDRAQTSARSDLVTANDLPPAEAPGRDGDGGEAGADRPRTASTDDGDLDADERPSPPRSDGRVVSEPTGETPELAELRAQLDDQFESIKIVEPGEYELNLMELYEREEYIIALQENGRYVIQMPETWMDEGADGD